MSGADGIDPPALPEGETFERGVPVAAPGDATPAAPAKPVLNARERAEAVARKHAADLARLKQRYDERVATLLAQREQYRRDVIDLRAQRKVAADEKKLLDALLVRTGYAEKIARGEDLRRAALRYMEELIAAKDRVFARSFAHGLLHAPETAEAGRLCTAVHAIGDGFDDYASSLIEQIDPATVAALIPDYHLALLLRRDPAQGETAIRAAMASAAGLPTSGWWRIARQAGALMNYALLRELIDHVCRVDPELAGLSEAEAIAFRWTAARCPDSKARAQVASPAGEITLGIIDYKALDRDRASSNVGDYVQTLAFLSNLLRYQDVEYDDTPLGRKLETMKDKIRPERRLSGLRARVNPVTVDRDFSSGTSFPTPTWTVVFGWYMHANFGEHFDFPLANGIRPIFISFHVNNRTMLSPDAVEYLKRYAPIGCRDWTTVYLLRERGIDCFFSGCMTTTIGQVFTAAPPAKAEGTLALVDYLPKPGEFPGRTMVKFTQAGDNVRDLDMVDGLDAAETLLNGYRAFDGIATSRLHCYLPCTSIGLDVAFRPRKRADIRFEGLLDLNEAGFNAIRSGIEHKVETILGVILGGAAEEEVYARWRALCAGDVAYAEQYCTTFPPLPAPSFDVPAAIAEMRAHCQLYNGPVDAEHRVNIAVALDENFRDHLPPVLMSAIEKLSRPATINILSRGLPASYFADIASHLPETCLRVFDCSGIDYGTELRMLKHTTVSTMDRLLLPELVRDTRRLIYLDIDLVVLGDLAELYELDLQGHALGGKESTYLPWRYGHGMVYRAAANLSAEMAWDLRRRMHAAGSLDFAAFNAGVMLLDLDRMRQDDFTRFAVPLVERYAMNDQDALNVYARANRIELGRVWNAVPSQDRTDDAKIVHFAGPVKPWDADYVLRQEDFEAARTRYETRRGGRSQG